MARLRWQRHSHGMRTPLLLLALLVIVAVGGLAIMNLAFDRTKVNTHAVAGEVREVVVRSERGAVELVPARAGVVVRETQHYLLRKPVLERSVSGGVLTVESRCDTYVMACYADLRISVPAGIEVTVDADSGDVDARRVAVRALHAGSDSGDLRLRLAGRQGLVWAHTDSGDIDAVAANVRAVDAQSDTGDVIVAAGGAPRRIVARTDSGDVIVAVPRGAYAVSADTPSGSVDFEGEISRNDRAERSIEAQSDSGDVTLRGG